MRLRKNEEKILKSLRYFAWTLCSINLLSYTVLLFTSIVMERPPKFIQRHWEEFIYFSLFSFGILAISVLIFKIRIIHSDVEIAKYIFGILFVINGLIGYFLYAVTHMNLSFG